MPPKRENNQVGGGGFEYCELCRRNHDQGRRHRYFPAHRAALATALSRFRSKLSDLRRALLRPSMPPGRSRLWCPFCSADLDSRFACSNAIYHLASREHLKGVKDFLRKHGGGMDQVDSFRISEDELAKWEKGCESSSTEAQSLTRGLTGPSLGLFKAMGPITLLVQRVVDLLLLEVLLILLLSVLLDYPGKPGRQHMDTRVCRVQTCFIVMMHK
ncbi:hypothetical protein ACQ4PT_042485 [Festuca glaucescens]